MLLLRGEQHPLLNRKSSIQLQIPAVKSFIYISYLAETSVVQELHHAYFKIKPTPVWVKFSYFQRK